MYSAVPTQRSVQIGVGILAVAAVIAMLYFGRVFFITVIIASMIAFLLEPLVGLFMKFRLPRGLASFVVCSMALAGLYLAGLGLYTEALSMVDDLPAYGARINELVDSAAGRLELFENNIYNTVVPKRFRDGGLPVPAPPDAKGLRGKKRPADVPPAVATIPEVRLHQDPLSIGNYLYDHLPSFYNTLLMASFVPFLVYFILAWRDQLRARFLAMMEADSRYTVSRVLDGVADMVRAYVIGNFLLGILLSVASGLLFASVRLPYAVVVAPLSGFLSLAPYIGLPLALIPPMIAALPVHSAPTLYLFLFVSVALLHLLALNLLYPKLVGSRVHLNPLVVTLALMFWGMLWGGIGLVLAIPLTAATRAICDNVPGLELYAKLLGD
jgi:predicted PurR-regulated permease PerM